MKFYTYTYTDPRTGCVFYVGMGSGNRYKVHLQNAMLADGSPKSCYILELRICGFEPIITIVFESHNREAAMLEERRLISIYSMDNLTNRTRGGQGHPGSTSFLGKRHSDDTKDKIRQSKLGKPGPVRTESANQKFIATIKANGHHQLGKPRSEEVKEKIRAKLTGVKLSDEQRKQRSDSMKAVWALRKSQQNLDSGYGL